MKLRLLTWGLLLGLTTAQPSPQPSSVSLIDLLSASPDHSLLLAAFQRARLIPTLNRMNGSTLFAPTNTAIREQQDKERQPGFAPTEAVWSLLDEDNTLAPLANDTKQRDNLQLALRDTLLYHLLNYTLFSVPIPTPPPGNDSTSAPPAEHNGDPPLTLSSLLPDNVVTLQETLYHPALSSYNKSFPAPPSLPGTPPDDPDPDAPKREEGLLRGEGQRLRVLRKGEKGNDREIWVGVDWKGQGGIKTVGKPVKGTRSALVPLGGVLEKPVDLSEQIRTNPELSTLASLLPTPILNYISTAPHLTLFAPTNEAWSALSDLELRYLRSGFAEMDLAEIFGDGASKDGAGNGKVGYLQSLMGLNKTEVSEVTTLWNRTLEVAPVDKGLVAVNGTAITTGDIFAKNGVIHTVPTLLLPSGSLSLTVEKYLIALNATKFVSLLRSVNLSHYVQIPSDQPTFLDTIPLDSSLPAASSQLPFGNFASDDPTPPKTAYTILAPRDDVMESKGFSNFIKIPGTDEDDGDLAGGRSLPAPGSEALKEVLQYHIVSGKWTIDELEDGMLVGTELRGENLKGARQRLAVSVHRPESTEAGGGWWVGAGKKKPEEPVKGVVGFGGASVIVDPVVVGDSIIYLISSILEPPSSVVTEAVSDLRLSTFVASVYAASLDKVLARQPAITYLVPSNNAYESLGLVMSYLLLPIARPELRALVKYHAVDEVVYLDEFPLGGAKRYPTLDSGAEIYIERDNENGTLSVHGPTTGGLPANGETRDANVVEGDILTATGVIHIIDQVELPPELDININKLLLGAKANTMVDLIHAANMSWVLEGKQPPVEPEGLLKSGKNKRRSKREAKTDRAYTILCPTDKALARLNLTYYLANPPALKALVTLHIIPTSAFAPLTPDGRPLPLTDEVTYSTLYDVRSGGPSQYGQVAFRRWGDDGWLVGIKSARGTNGLSDSARVVAYGRASPWFFDAEGAGGDGGKVSRAPRLAGGGGVLTIDSVLVPYEPGWFRRFGWIVAVAVLGTLVLVMIVLLGLKMWRGSRKVPFEPLEGEED